MRKLFTATMLRPQNRRLPEHPVVDRWTEVMGWRLYAREWPGPSSETELPVVLVHGLSVSSRYMVPLGQRLAEHYSVYAPDLPGFGRSEKPPYSLGLDELADALAAWMDALDLGQAALVGNSAGCQVIIELALRQPERAACAVLVGPTVDRQKRTLAQLAAGLLLDVWREPPSLIAITLRDYYLAGLFRTVRMAQSLLRDAVEAKVNQLHRPVLVVRGERDAIVSQPWVEEVARRLPEGHLLVIPGGAHGVHYSAAGRVGRAVHAFLEQRCV